MPEVKHILSLSLSAMLLTSAACTQSIAQSFDNSTVTRFQERFTIGFERNINSLFTPRYHGLSKQTKQAEELCNRIVFRMRVTTRFRIETGLSFKAIDRILNTRYSKQFNVNEPMKLQVPVTIQYQFAANHKKIRPYFGAGIQYTQQYAASTTSTLNATEGNGDYNNYNLTNSLHYMNIIFTQGIIYDINPNLQLSQSIHISPENGMKPIGINIGVGYRIK